MADYHDAIESDLIPAAKERGVELMGAYRHAIRPNEGINLWYLKDWDHARAVWETDRDSPHGNAGGLLADFHAHLIVRPPRGRAPHLAATEAAHDHHPPA